MLSKIVFAACMAFVVSADKKEKGRGDKEDKDDKDEEETRYAICRLQDQDDLVDPPSNDGYDVSGLIAFKEEKKGDLEITAVVEGLKSNFFHGFHIHAFGDISGGCGSTTGHFNPKEVDHGEWSNSKKERHHGDLRGLLTDENGRADYEYTDALASLYGKDSIVGRSLVIHDGNDNFGLPGDDTSLANGRAGARMACCVIGLAPEEYIFN